MDTGQAAKGLLAALVVLSLLDFGLTVYAANNVPGFQELNPVVSEAAENGEYVSMLALKLFSFFILAVAVRAAKPAFLKPLNAVMAVFCGVFALVNALSIAQLSGV